VTEWTDVTEDDSGTWNTPETTPTRPTAPGAPLTPFGTPPVDKIVYVDSDDDTPVELRTNFGPNGRTKAKPPERPAPKPRTPVNEKPWQPGGPVDPTTHLNPGRSLSNAIPAIAGAALFTLLLGGVIFLGVTYQGWTSPDTPAPTTPAPTSTR
jgi:hypothetical protein